MVVLIRFWRSLTKLTLTLVLERFFFTDPYPDFSGSGPDFWPIRTQKKRLIRTQSLKNSFEKKYSPVDDRFDKDPSYICDRFRAALITTFESILVQEAERRLFFEKDCSCTKLRRRYIKKI